MILLPALDPTSLPALLQCLDRLGVVFRIAERPDEGSLADGVLLTSALSFEQGGAWLRQTGWWHELPHLLSKGTPVLALDGAMHLLAERSEEAPKENGLGLLPGCVRRLGPGVKLPHLGWAQVRECRPQEGLPDPAGVWLYFQHAYALDPDGATGWEARHGRAFAVLSQRGRTLGCQARLPQSGAQGRLMLQRLLRALGMIPRVG